MKDETHLLVRVHKSIADVPLGPITNSQLPWQRRLVEVNQQAEGKIPQLDALMVEAGAR